MGELEVLTCVYCGEILQSTPTIKSDSDKPEVMFYCPCGGVAFVALEN